jgi:hypothetical protein
MLINIVFTSIVSETILFMVLALNLEQYSKDEYIFYFYTYGYLMRVSILQVGQFKA